MNDIRYWIIFLWIKRVRSTGVMFKCKWPMILLESPIIIILVIERLRAKFNPYHKACHYN